MTRIERHIIPFTHHAHRNYKSGLGYLEERSNRTDFRPSSMPLQVTQSLIIVQVGYVVASEPAEWEPSLVTAAEAADCMFATGGRFQDGLTYFGRPVRFDSKADESNLYASRWLEAFCLNLICRRPIALQRLARTPESSLIGSSTIEPKCRFHIAEAIQAAWLDMDGWKVGEFLVQAMEATDPDRLRPSAVASVLHFDVPHIQLITHLLQRDESKFESCLVEALLLHKEFWSMHDEEHDNRADPRGWLSLTLTGLAAAAWDAGMRFDIDSEYLPMRLVTGEFLKDLPSTENPA